MYFLWIRSCSQCGYRVLDPKCEMLPFVAADHEGRSVEITQLLAKQCALGLFSFMN